ncbi:MAG: hypothetical protein OXT67_13535, partial [Zetaproteobacteria bacterium]|nr:hypothetical protein [Zetaproteobacteria bacterium]
LFIVLFYVGSTKHLFGKPAAQRIIGFQQLPLDVQQKIMLRVMHESPQDIENIAEVNQEMFALFLQHRSQLELLYPQHIAKHLHLWILHALENQAHHTQPKHLQLFLRFENQQLAKVLAMKSAALTTSQEWKLHGAALVAAYAYTASLIYSDVMIDAKHAVRKLVQQYLDDDQAQNDAVMYIERYVTHDAPLANAKYTVSHSLHDASWDHLDVGASMASSDITEEALEWFFAQMNKLDTDMMGKSAYYVAETVSWLMMLDPQRDIFGRVYDKVRARLVSSGVVDPEGWFVSSRELEQKIAHYFGRDGELGRDGNHVKLAECQYVQRYKYVEFYIQQLRDVQCMIEKLEQQGL